MQNILKKNPLFLYLLLCPLLIQAAPQDILQQGDSLFRARRYVQAFEHYQFLMEEEKKASPAMLLKMSYIQEGLGQIDEALYYLNMYYLQTTDEKVLDKMENLAEDNDLAGYDAGDFEFFISYYYRYYQQITLLLAALTFLFFALLIYRKRQGAQRPLATGIVLLIFLGLLFYQVNMGKDYGKGIIQMEETYIMSGPSAGAGVVDIISAGHRVDVLGHQDVWTRINWDGEIAYVKNKNLRNIGFL